MDVGTWLNALGQVSLLLVAVHVTSASVIGAASASLARLPLWIGVAGGLVFPLLGPVVLIITAAVRSGRRARVSSAATPHLEPPGARASQFDQPSIWSRPTSDEGVFTSSFSSDPFRSVQVKIRGGRGKWRIRTTGGLVGLAVLVAVTLGATATLFIRWFKFDSKVIPPMSVWAWGSGIDALVLVSVAVLIVACVLSAFRASHWSAILVANVGAIWATISGVSLALTVPVTELLRQLGAFSYTVGDLLSTLNVQNDRAGFDLPPGLDLTALGIAGSHIDLNVIDLAAPVPSATLELGAAFFVALGVGVVALAWSVAELIAVRRSNRSRRPTKTTL